MNTRSWRGIAAGYRQGDSLSTQRIRRLGLLERLLTRPLLEAPVPAKNVGHRFYFVLRLLGEGSVESCRW